MSESQFHTMALERLGETDAVGFYPTPSERAIISGAILRLQSQIKHTEDEIRRLQQTGLGLEKKYEKTKKGIAKSPPKRLLSNILQLGKEPPPSSLSISALNALIGSNQSALEKRLTCYEHCKKDLRLYEALLSPSRNIPAEIWEQIFTYCLPNEDYIVPRTNSAPLVLCQVNKLWRRVATSLPRLWCSLSVRVTKRLEWRMFLDKWLGRSGQLPLSLEISLHPVRPGVHQGSELLHDYVLRHVGSYAARWRRLRFTLHRNSICSRVRGMLSMPMPLLEVLEMNSSVPDVMLNIRSGRAPKLKVLLLMKAEQNPLHLSMPWGQLTHFKSHYALGAQKTLGLLGMCPNLEECDVRVASFRSTAVAAEVERLRLAKLRVLRVCNSGGQNLDEFFDRLELPSAWSLEIVTEGHSRGDDAPWTARSVGSLAARGGGRLRRLVVVGYACGVLDMPSVVEISVRI